jgi:hypothetical protein
MSREYHYLVAGLPDLLFDATKLNVTVPEFKNFVKEQLSDDDNTLAESYFWRYDNQNLLAILQNKEQVFNTKGNLTREDWEVVLDLVKNDELGTFYRHVPGYFKDFIEAYREDRKLFEGASRENELTRLYYGYLLSLDNEFIRNWYGFELDIENILTASVGKKYQIDIENELIGDRELNEKLKKSSARDFGLGNDFPRNDHIFKAVDEPNLLEREKRIDFVKWDVLDEWSFFYYFTIERIFVYLVQLDIIDRWIKLDKKTGEELFNRMLKNLETQNRFPENL